MAATTGFRGWGAVCIWAWVGMAVLGWTSPALAQDADVEPASGKTSATVPAAGDRSVPADSTTVASGGNLDDATTTATDEVALIPAPRPALPPLSRLGVNLAKAVWFASADLPPSASPEQIRASATRTSPTVQLRTTPGESGVLFALLELESPPLTGAVVTLGDVDGSDECWMNGTRVGGTSGRGITDFGVSRTYYVPRESMRKGTNVLALRLTGEYGKGEFGLRREPITFGFVPAPPQRQAALQADAPEALRGLAAITPDEAARAIEAADPGVTETAALVRRRAGFGRFGWLMNDGLAAMSEVSPTRVVNREGPKFEVALDRVETLAIASGEKEPGIDSYHKLVRVKGPCARRPVEYTMLQHVMYPGAVITLEKGSPLQLRVEFSGRVGSMQTLSEAEVAAVSPSLAEAGVSVFAFYDADERSVPALLAVAGGAANVTLSELHIDVTVSRGTDAKSPAKIYIFHPTGLDRVDLSGKPASFFALAAAVVPGDDPVQVVRRWMRLGLHEPVAVDEYARVHASEEFVRVYQVARYAAPAGVDLGPAYMPLPPQISFARSTYRYPVRLPDATTATGVMSFSGPMEAVDADAVSTASDLAVASYDLPIPPMSERGLISVPGTDDLRALLNTCVEGLTSSPLGNGVDLFYKGRTQAFQAYSYLTTDTRTRLLESTSALLPAALIQSSWQETTEPLSGLPFWWTYYIEGPYFGRYDQDWGNGLSLVGLYTAVKYTGQWEVVLEHWDAVERMASWFEATDDWEWMRASNAVHGHGTGAGDCASATYAAALAYARLARHAGRTDDAYYGTWQAARAAVFLLNRFAYNPHAQEQDFKQGESLVLGFHEGRGFLEGELDGYPWNVTSLISGNGVQPENFDLYVKYAPNLLREYERTFEKAYPKWADGTFKYGRPTIYRDNSGYITLPHIYLRARLKTDGAEALDKLLTSARKNEHLWWLAPPVVGEVMNLRYDGLVTDWGRCGFLGAEVMRDTAESRRRRIEAHFDNRFAPDTVEFQLPRRAGQVQINDGPVPLTDLKYENGRLQLRLRRPGLNKVVLVY
ncbi:hypothetical protein CVU37_02480 [candidate division BRC1 bacterium HGW-BRC1-1]|nr:MAG: hypothetical protein CVU37_02480 [candidate division BRC1 bacterium HGW-BRC1-1]